MTRTLLLALPFVLVACQPQDEATAFDLEAAPVESISHGVEANGASAVRTVAAVGDKPHMTVYKRSTCGCCSSWIAHLEESGYTVDAIDRDADLHVVKDSLGLPQDLSSCHTGVVDGYVVEGHVPAEQIDRLLEERPEALGIAVPGMPIGSPGMEMGDQRDPYDVLIVGEGGEAAVYASIPGNTAR